MLQSSSASASAVGGIALALAAGTAVPGGVLYTCFAARLAARLAVALAARLRSAAARFAGTGAGGPAGAGAGAGAGSCAGAGMGGAGAGGAAAAAAFARSIAAAAAALGFADFASAAGDDEAAAARLRLEEGGASASAARAVFLIARPPRLRCSIPSASRDSILVNAATPETNVGSQHCLSVLVIGRVRLLFRVRSAFWISPGRQRVCHVSRGIWRSVCSPSSWCCSSLPLPKRRIRTTARVRARRQLAGVRQHARRSSVAASEAVQPRRCLICRCCCCTAPAACRDVASGCLRCGTAAITFPPCRHLPVHRLSAETLNSS